MTYASSLTRALSRFPLVRWMRAHRALTAVAAAVGLLVLAGASVLVGLWHALPPGAEYRRAFAAAPLSSRVSDRTGLVANLPLGTGAPTYTPVVSLGELPEGFLDELRLFEGMPRSGVPLGGLWRTLRGQNGAAPLTAQAHRVLWQLEHPDESPPHSAWWSLTQLVASVKIATYVPREAVEAFYVNHVQVVPGPPGFEAAARGRFGKRAAELTPPEWRLLMACLSYPAHCRGEAPTPSRLAAFDAKTESAADRGLIPASALPSQRVPPSFATETAVFYRGAGPVLDRAAAETKQILHEGGWDFGRDGLTVTLTADLALSDSLARRLEDAVDATPGAEFASAVVLDPSGGVVVYAVGTRAGASGRPRARGTVFDALDADRGHPASTLKVPLYVMLVQHYLNAGVPPDSIPKLRLPNHWVRPDGKPVSPGCGGARVLTLSAAIRCSANGVAAHALNEILSPVAFAQFLGTMGVRVEPHWSLALGVADVRAIDLAAVYATLIAQDGLLVRPHLVESVWTRDARPVYDASQWVWPTRRVADARAPRIVRQMLGGTVDAGGTVRRLIADDPDLADWMPRFKTGSSEGRYRWLTVVGTVVPPGGGGRHTVLVRMEGRLGRDLSAGRVAVPILSDVFREAWPQDGP